MSTSVQGPLLMTPREVAESLRISERHLYSLTKAGAIPCARLGRSVRYSPDAVKKFVENAEKAIDKAPRIA